ncbi:hypothetical protein V2J09_002758 [Rumex salicifolius]
MPSLLHYFADTNRVTISRCLEFEQLMTNLESVLRGGISDSINNSVVPDELKRIKSKAVNRPWMHDLSRYSIDSKSWDSNSSEFNSYTMLYF